MNGEIRGGKAVQKFADIGCQAEFTGAGRRWGRMMPGIENGTQDVTKHTTARTAAR